MRKSTLFFLLFALAVLVIGPRVMAQEGEADTTKKATEATLEDAGDSATDVAEATGSDEPAATEEAVQDSVAAEGTEEPAAGEDVAPDSAEAVERTAEEGQDETGEETVAESEPEDPNAPYASITFDEGEKPRLVMETSMGNIVIELWPDLAPKHCQSMVYLANTGFYDSLTFHRIVPGFVIQGGDPNGNGSGGPGYNVPAEFNPTLHEDGILSMARAADPNSAGSQFFICLGRLASLDNKYTVFGKVVEGLQVVHQIEKVPVNGERPKTPVVMMKVYVEEKN